MTASRGLRRAKRMLKKRFEHCDWYSGVGIVPTTHGPGLRLTATRTPDKDEVPSDYYGFPLEVVVIRAYHQRERS